MPLTPEERSIINKANASKSTGATSAAGKARSRANSLRHGLRAEVLALPDEDPAVVAARAESWNSYYQPQSPAAQHLVKQCVQATLLADRCNRYHAAALSTQIRKASGRSEATAEERLLRLVSKLRDFPAITVRKLSRSARGCRWMIERWTHLADALADDDLGWNEAQLGKAIRLLGELPTAWKSKPEVYKLTFLNLLGTGLAPASLIAPFLVPQNIPWELAGVYDPGALPTREECRGYLATFVADVLARLKTTEASLRETIEEPDRAETSDRAAILTDPAKAPLFLRYQAEARTLFHRSYNELVRTLKRDESGPYRAEDMGAPDPMLFDEPECDSMFTTADDEPIESDPPTADPGSDDDPQVVEEPPVAAISPNEAKTAPSGTSAGVSATGLELMYDRNWVQPTVNLDPNGSPGRVDERRRLV